MSKLYGITDAAASKPKFLGRGHVASVTVTAGGTGYGAAPSVTISAPAAPTGRQATATASISGGAVVGVTITDPGAGYTRSDTVTVSFGSGAAAATAGLVYGNYADSEIVFVSREESQLAENRAIGLRSPGWWLSKSFTDAAGNTRYKNEHIIAVDVTNANAGDAADDQVVPDKGLSLTNPGNRSILAGATTTFATTATTDPAGGSLTYAWEVSTNGGTSYSTLADAGVYSGSATNTLTITAPTVGYTGYKYRVVVSGTGYKTKTTRAATLTVTEE